MAVRHDLHLHDFLMIGTVIVHHCEKRNPVVRSGPENPGGIHKIAVALDVDGEASILTIGQRSTHSGGGAVADTGTTVAADILVIFVKGPEALGPAIDKGGGGNERPIFVFDISP